MPDSDPYASERYNPHLAHCTTERLSFNGSRLTFSNATQTTTYHAASGRPDSAGRFDYSAARQRMAGMGPIPEGVYWINPAQLWENAWYKFAPTAGWGNYRITLHPFTTTATFGRGGFFIHGGSVPGSAGCIDLASDMDRFAADLRRRVGARTCQIHLTVDYP